MGKFIKIGGYNELISAIVMGLFLIPTPEAAAAIPREQESEIVPPQTYLEVISVEEITFPPPLIDTGFVRKVIPLNLNPEAQDQVVPRIVDHSLSSLMNSPLMRDTKAVRAMKAVEEGLGADVEIKSENSEVTHKLEFQMQALQQSAIFLYSGITDARLHLNMETEAMRIQVRERLNDSQMLVVRYDQTRDGRSAQHVGWEYKW